jgi:hypothetical protein
MTRTIYYIGKIQGMMMRVSKEYSITHVVLHGARLTQQQHRDQCPNLIYNESKIFYQ